MKTQKSMNGYSSHELCFNWSKCFLVLAMCVLLLGGGATLAVAQEDPDPVEEAGLGIAGEVKTGTPSTAAPANSQGNSIEPPQANPMSPNPTQTPAPKGQPPPGPSSASIPSSESPPVSPTSASDSSPQKPTD